MTDDELNEIEKRADKATPGPWHRDGRGGFRGPPDEVTHGEGVVTASAYPGQEGLIFASPNDAAFIIGAREDVPALVGEVRRLKSAKDGWERATRGAESDLDAIRSAGVGLLGARGGGMTTREIGIALADEVRRLRDLVRALETHATPVVVSPASADVCAARHARAVAWGRPADLDVPCDGCNVGATEPCKGTEPATETGAGTLETSEATAKRVFRECQARTGPRAWSALDYMDEAIRERDRQTFARLDAAFADHEGDSDGFAEAVVDLRAELRRSAS